MKVLMIMMTMLVATSTYAEACKVGEKCTAAECSKLGTHHALNAAGICIDSTSGENKSSGCPNVVAKGAPNEKKKTDTVTGDEVKTTTKPVDIK